MADDISFSDAAALLRADGPMTSDEFRACVRLLEWTARGLADLIEVDEGTVRQWGRAKRPIPDPVAAWLRTIARVHADNPPPVRPLRPRAAA